LGEIASNSRAVSFSNREEEVSRRSPLLKQEERLDDSKANQRTRWCSTHRRRFYSSETRTPVVVVQVLLYPPQFSAFAGSSGGFCHFNTTLRERCEVEVNVLF
jgi:acetoin utilization deacetylase AcuC-like enzyme